ncbi:DUF4192 domain-containing protein [Streptomyces sp. NPDC005962]|uniref:DUF4192 domain-containing protein n=1 Tax=Streptomyces sp. NPDC005962 TaxID=3154466 RepID=UPI0033EA62E3
MIVPENKLIIRSLANLAEILPFMLGHYPDDSMVLHNIGPNLIDGPTMASPLPDDPADWKEEAELFARRFMTHVQENAHDTAGEIIVYLCREPEPGQSAEQVIELLRPVSNSLTETCTQLRGSVTQTLGLVAGRWWAFECEWDGCCEGDPLPALDDPKSAAAQLIRMGYSPGRRTGEIVKEFHPAQPAAPGQLRVLDNEAAAYAAQCATPGGQEVALDVTHWLLETAIRAFRDGATDLADDMAARLIHGLQNGWACDHGIEFAEDDDLPHARRLWSFLARRCLPPYTQKAVPLLSLLAWVAWRQDDTLTARLALKDALTADPDYELAGLLVVAINEGEDPQGLLNLARETRAERLARTTHSDPTTH